jgi:hypothetical protein
MLLYSKITISCLVCVCMCVCVCVCVCVYPRMQVLTEIIDMVLLIKNIKNMLLCTEGVQSGPAGGEYAVM